MRVLAIDPGDVMSGVVVFDGESILYAGNIDNQEILRIIEGKSSLVEEYEYLVIENITSYGMAVGSTTFNTCIWIGRFIQQSLNKKNHNPTLIPRIEIKNHHCHTSRAKDSNIIQALKDRFGEKGTKKNPGFTYRLSKHSWQAFALAVYYFDNNPVQPKKAV